jgi:hypothetical protein
MVSNENLCPLEGVCQNGKPATPHAVASALNFDKPTYWFFFDHRHHSISAIRLIAGLSGFFTLIQSGHRPDRYGRSRRFATMPSGEKENRARAAVHRGPSGTLRDRVGRQGSMKPEGKAGGDSTKTGITPGRRKENSPGHGSRWPEEGSVNDRYRAPSQSPTSSGRPSSAQREPSTISATLRLYLASAG